MRVFVVLEVNEPLDPHIAEIFQQLDDCPTIDSVTVTTNELNDLADTDTPIAMLMVASPGQSWNAMLERLWIQRNPVIPPEGWIG